LIYVIGAGGVGSWLVPKLTRLTKNLFVVDGDTLEEKNLDRQLFEREQIGQNKAAALAAKYHLQAHIPEYYHVGLFQPERDDILVCCADNHACRREVLMGCDAYGCRAIIAANEYTDAEAYFYENEWQGTPNDPRVVYPDILTDHAGDPLGPPGCIEAARKTPQLVLANALAADMAGWLYWFHTKDRLALEPETKPFWPVHHKSSIYTMKTIRFGDRLTGGCHGA
jgi:hypothetical protein